MLLAQADRARPVLADGLAAVGHTVESVAAYRTACARPTADESPRCATVDAVVLASGSAADGLVGGRADRAPAVGGRRHRPGDRGAPPRAPASRVDHVAASPDAGAWSRPARARGPYHDRDARRPFPVDRPRRLRRTPALRDLVAETHRRTSDLVAPLFVREGITEPQPITSLPGVVQHTRESLRKEVAELADLGVRAVVLFGVPARKDAVGSGAFDPDGIVQLALADLRGDVGDDVVLMADLCVDEYTDHGHCGVLDEHGDVDNDAHARDLRQGRARPGHAPAPTSSRRAG